MQIDILVDLQYGSCGKGKFAYELAAGIGYSLTSSANMPNAGHTVVRGDKRHVYKALPSASMLVDSALCATAVFSPAQLLEESTWTNKHIYIHENARTVLQEDKATESASDLSNISSTLQGCTPSMIRRIMRDPIGRVGTHKKVFSSFPDHKNITAVSQTDWVSMVHSADTVLHEVAQGTMLSADWGYFPYTTSRNCTAQDGLSAVGANWSNVRDCYGVLRAHPIRVGGPSGPMPHETTWERVGESAGMTKGEIDETKAREHTTVTKKQRRVSDISISELKYAVRLNGCTKLILNFAQYIDWAALGCSRFVELPKRVVEFVSVIEKQTGVPVVAIGTSETTTIWR